MKFAHPQWKLFKSIAKRKPTPLTLTPAALLAGLSELRELRQLRDENAKLKKLVADLSLDRHMLQEIVRKKL